MNLSKTYNRIPYRPDIDGLRSIAVISVLLYHLQLTFEDIKIFQGGFLGVDIFFVISGYLITSIIYNEVLISNKFSFINFYQRRIRRLLPVLIFIAFVTFFLAWKYMMPTNFVEYSKSIIYSVFFSSNIFFYLSELEYVQQDALLTPFLHTWSLAVEEQFYILFPIFFLIIIKLSKKNIICILTSISIISLILASYYSNVYPSSSFYFIHTRIWELLLGSILACLEINKGHRGNKLSYNFFFQIIGLALIFFSIIYFDDNIKHPSYLTLMPVVGTAILIWFSQKENLLIKILSSKLFVSIGLISYSLYLWHYPIFAFGRLQQENPSIKDKFEWLVLSFVLSILTYYFIEKPFRIKNKKFNFYRISKIISLSILILISLNLYSIKNKGFTERQMITENFILDQKGYAINDHYKFRENYSPKAFSLNSSKKNILIVGNSYGEDFLKLFELNQDLFNQETISLISPLKRNKNLVYEVSCLKELIVKNNTLCNNFEFTNNILDQYKKSDIIIFSSKWNMDDLDLLDQTVKLLKKDKKKIIITSHSLESKIFMPHNMNFLDSIVFKKRKLLPEDINYAEKIMYTYIQNLEKINTKLFKIASDNKVIFFDQQSFQCNHDLKICDVITPKGNKIYWDYGHYTSEGAKYLGKKIFEKKLLNFSL
jgi:peptidoglycan/LPS O-acetylase OafA/YrhL